MPSPHTPFHHAQWMASSDLPTQHGIFAMHVFRAIRKDDAQGFREHVALVHGEVSGKAGLPDDARTYEVVPDMLAHFEVPASD